MGKSDLTSNPSRNSAGDSDSGPPAAHKAVAPPPGSTLPGFFWARGVIAALIVGTVAWALGEATFNRYQPSRKAAAEPYAFMQLNLEKDHADGLNGAIAFGSLGALTGLALGLMGGWARKSVRGAILGGIAGILLGGVAGAVPSPPVIPLHRQYYEPAAPDLKLPILIHGAIWCSLGVAAGLAFGIGLGNRRQLFQAAIGGLIGAALATLAYDAMGAIFFPFSEADLPISPSILLRFLARIFVAIGVVVGTIMTVGSGLKAVPRKKAISLS